MRLFTGYFLIAIAFIIIICTRIDGIDYTEGQLLIHYWKEYLVAIALGGAALWLTSKYKS